jgi:hypothetical protein
MRRAALASCSANGNCAVASNDLLRNSGGVDTQAPRRHWKAAVLIDGQVLNTNGIVGAPVSMSCSAIACVVAYRSSSDPAPSNIVYGTLASGIWRALSISDLAPGRRTNFLARNFMIDGRCVVEWFPGVARQGCPA